MRVSRTGAKLSDGAPSVAVAGVEDVETSETRRALIGAALGVAMGIVVALFAKRDERDERDGAAEGGRGWRGKSAT